jgi:DNA adenine methylase
MALEGEKVGQPARIFEKYDQSCRTRPILKWAGGKQQLLDALLERLPSSFGRYLEPMVGGGALFFGLAPRRAVIADSNPELINLYRTVVTDLDGIEEALEEWSTDETTYYRVRSFRFEELEPATAAARLIYLNRTCFNGLYRVNRHGQFNVPWGQYSRPKVFDRERIEAARDCLRAADIRLGDYAEILRSTAKAGDVVFLDPPYLPISEYSDFKRYTKVQFKEDDHHAMREIVEMLRERGCYTLITNSNHPLMHNLYKGFPIDVLDTRRNINSRADGRKGQDIIISVPPRD